MSSAVVDIWNASDHHNDSRRQERMQLEFRELERRSRIAFDRAFAPEPAISPEEREQEAEIARRLQFIDDDLNEEETVPFHSVSNPAALRTVDGNPPAREPQQEAQQVAEATPPPQRAAWIQAVADKHAAGKGTGIEQHNSKSVTVATSVPRGLDPRTQAYHDGELFSSSEPQVDPRTQSDLNGEAVASSSSSDEVQPSQPLKRQSIRPIRRVPPTAPAAMRNGRSRNASRPRLN